MERLRISYAEDSSFWAVEGVDKVSYASRMGEDMLHLRMDCHDLCIARRFDENSQSYANTVTLDRTVYRKADKGVNILVYDTVTQSVADSFGIQVESLNDDDNIIR